MKRLLLIVLPLLLIVGCSKEPINNDVMLKYERVGSQEAYEKKIKYEGVYYTKDTNKPYSGPIFSVYKNGDKKSEGNLKDGKKDGLFTGWYQSNIDGIIITYRKENWKDGMKHGLQTYWYRNGLKKDQFMMKNGIPTKIIINDGKKIL